VNDKEKDELLLGNQTGALLMLDKKERKLIKLLLNQFMKTEKAKGYIEKNLGQEFIEIGEKLLETMGAP